MTRSDILIAGVQHPEEAFTNDVAGRGNHQLTKCRANSETLTQAAALVALDGASASAWQAEAVIGRSGRTSGRQRRQGFAHVQQPIGPSRALGPLGVPRLRS